MITVFATLHSPKRTKPPGVVAIAAVVGQGKKASNSLIPKTMPVHLVGLGYTLKSLTNGTAQRNLKKHGAHFLSHKGFPDTV
jgi:hypothetical protein